MWIKGCTYMSMADYRPLAVQENGIVCTLEAWVLGILKQIAPFCQQVFTKDDYKKTMTENPSSLTYFVVWKCDNTVQAAYDLNPDN